MNHIPTFTVTIDSRQTALEGILTLPDTPKSIVAFAHGSGSSRFSQRNRFVAEILNEAGLATLLFDLLSADESDHDELTGEYRFDIPLLAQRMTDAIDWLGRDNRTFKLPIGLFGASTGAAAALIAAAQRPNPVYAVVSRGGRPDLAGDRLSSVKAPTLLIVGGWDRQVIALNEMAAKGLRCEHQITIVPDATHLFEEPGKLEEVAQLARDWFLSHLAT